ncbi:MAG: hypothetical protein H7834_16110 [Magnetococcus sp. YQC-9]
MNQLRILLLTLMAAFLVGGLLNQRESDNFTSDMLFTLAFFAYIWHVLRRNRGATPPTQQPSRTVPTEAPMERGATSPSGATQPSVESAPKQQAPVQQPTPAQKPLPAEQSASRQPQPSMSSPASFEPAKILFSTKPARPSGRIILHKLPWAVVEQGKPVGKFRHVSIPAWIRTTDNRLADYAGIALTPPPEGCVCLEIPDQAELILPPGLIYALRT